MNELQFAALHNRRRFLSQVAGGLGAAALGDLLHASEPARLPQPHFSAKAKHVIYMFMEGGPSQYELFDPKPGLRKSRWPLNSSHPPCSNDRIPDEIRTSPVQPAAPPLPGRGTCRWRGVGRLAVERDCAGRSPCAHARMQARSLDSGANRRAFLCAGDAPEVELSQ